jgi:hypothetical protein
MPATTSQPHCRSPSGRDRSRSAHGTRIIVASVNRIAAASIVG